MNKKLPEMFINELNKPAGNNNKVFYSSKQNERNERNEIPSNNEPNITQKISNIFNSSNYIYKADVEIKKRDQSTINKRIVGRNNNYLISIDNELIPIVEILDIKRK